MIKLNYNMLSTSLAYGYRCSIHSTLINVLIVLSCYHVIRAASVDPYSVFVKKRMTLWRETESVVELRLQGRLCHLPDETSPDHAMRLKADLRLYTALSNENGMFYKDK